MIFQLIFYITSTPLWLRSATGSRVTFPFIPSFDQLFDRDSSRQGSGEPIGRGARSAIGSNLLLSHRLAPFSFGGLVAYARGEHEPYKIFMR